MNKYWQMFVGGLGAGASQYAALTALGITGTPLIIGAVITALTTIGGVAKNTPRRSWSAVERQSRNKK
jgi:hypothetical protein